MTIWNTLYSWIGEYIKYSEYTDNFTNADLLYAIIYECTICTLYALVIIIYQSNWQNMYIKI